MNAKTSPPEAAKKPDRKARLAEELRANLQRRKAQARSRRTGGADERPDGLTAAGKEQGNRARDVTDRIAAAFRRPGACRTNSCSLNRAATMV